MDLFINCFIGFIGSYAGLVLCCIFCFELVDRFSGFYF